MIISKYTKTALVAMGAMLAGTALAPADPALPAGGFGLLHVRERLATLHGDRASFSLEPVADGEAVSDGEPVSDGDPVTDGELLSGGDELSAGGAGSLVGCG